MLFRRIAEFVLHLRLPFNFVLAPLFVWGAFVGRGALEWRFWVGLVSFHLFLYGGTNMFNSFYDQDEGPIGGLENPPPVDRTFLWGSLVLKLAGFLLALLLPPMFIVCYLVFVGYSISYSHPAIRIKRRPLASALTVFIGQGLVGYVAGWSAASAPAELLLTPAGLLGALAGAALVSGLYPLTQVYQLEEDQARGDMTLARRLGVNAAFVYSALWLTVGSVAGIGTLWRLGLPWQGAFLAIYFIGLLAAVAHLGSTLRGRESRAVYRHVMRMNYINSAMLLTALFTMIYLYNA